MKVSTFLVLAAYAVLANAKIRGMKKGKMSHLKNPKKMNKKPFSSMLKKVELDATEEEPKDTMRYFKESILTIEGLEPGIELTPAETVFLEDLILMNLNMMDAPDNTNSERKYHTILFSGNKHDRELSTLNQHGWVDEYVFKEYTCRYCPQDDDDWVPPPKPTKAPSAPKPNKKHTKKATKKPNKKTTRPPTDAPSVDIKEALKKTLGAFQANLCKGASNSSFFRLRKITGCHFK
jgi:hypothetical protein